MAFDPQAIRQIFSLESAAAITAACIFLLTVRLWNGIPALLDKWLAFRTAKAAEKAADWTRLRDEVVRLSEAEERCRKELANITRELARMQGYTVGRGEARQEASILSSAKRITDEDTPNK